MEFESFANVVATRDEAVELLCQHAAAVFAPNPRDMTRLRKFPVELRFETDGGAIAAHRGVVDIGYPTAASSFPLRWEPASHQRLLPAFSGTLDVQTDSNDDAAARLHLQGSYQPPFGTLGAYGDGLIGRRIARRCLEELVAELAERLEHHATQRRASQAWTPAVPGWTIEPATVMP